MNKQSEKSLTGSLLEIVGPILIMLMVGSVVWFLIEVFYRGPHNARLCWVFGLYTAAAVLVSRISIESSRERSFVFAVPLALAAIFVSLTLIEGGPMFPVLLIVFVLLILWLSDRLTWDATVIDASRDVSSVGLVELARRRLHFSVKENKNPLLPGEGSPAIAQADVSMDDDPTGEIASDAQAGNLIRALTGKGKCRNVPGIWSLHFSVGAMVVFGIGQLFVRPDFDWGYLWVSTLFAVFIAASMSLMTLTSLLGLQRYLLKRKLDMPDDLPRRWLTAGISIAFAAGILTLLVPRPNLPGRLENAVAWLTSRPRDPAKFAFGRDGTQQGESPQSATTQPNGSVKPDSGKSGQQPVRDNSQNNPANQPQSDSAGNSQTGSGAPPGGNSGNGKQSPGSESGGTQPGGKSGTGQSGQQQSGSQSESSSQQNQSDQKQSATGEGGDKSNSENKSGGEKSGGENSEVQKPGDNQKNANDSANKQTPPQSPSGGSASLSSTAGKMAKLLVMFIGLIALLVVGWLFREEIAKLLVELRNWLNGLASRKAPDSEPTADLARIAKADRRVSFAECRNPFRDGSFRNLNPRQLAQQTFLAMEALAGELKVTRAVELTPAEFAAEIASTLKGLAVPASSLADVYGWAAYSGSDVSSDQLKQLQLIWKQMEQFSSTTRSGGT